MTGAIAFFARTLHRPQILDRLTDSARRLSEVTTAHAAELDRLRADATRERDELRELLDDRARMLTEARDEQRQRAERAEHELGQARGERAQLRAGTRKDAAQESAAAPGGETPQRRRRGGSKEAQ